MNIEQSGTVSSRCIDCRKSRPVRRVRPEVLRVRLECVRCIDWRSLGRLGRSALPGEVVVGRGNVVKSAPIQVT